MVGFSWCSYKVKFSSPLESFSWRWAGRLWFLAIFPSPLLGAPTFLLYSPSWLILALHLLVRQVLISVSIPSTVPSYFLLVAKIEVYTVQTSFLINRIWTLAGAFNAEGTHFPWSNFTPCFPVGPIPLTSPSGGCLGITFTKTLIFSLKSWRAEDRVVLSRSPWHPGHQSFVLGTRPLRHGPWAQIEFGPDCKLPGPTIAPQNPAIRLFGQIGGFWWHQRSANACQSLSPIGSRGFSPTQGTFLEPLVGETWPH